MMVVSHKWKSRSPTSAEFRTTMKAELKSDVFYTRFPPISETSFTESRYFITELRSPNVYQIMNLKLNSQSLQILWATGLFVSFFFEKTTFIVTKSPSISSFKWVRAKKRFIKVLLNRDKQLSLEEIVISAWVY